MFEIPIENLSFSAYRPAYRDGTHGAPTIFLSLAHWFEAERFRAFAPELFLQVIHCPSIKEAHKFAKRNQHHTRGDWMAVRARALACGMVYAQWADSDHPRWRADSATLVAELAPLDIPEKIVAEAATEFVRIRDTRRIVFLGAGASSPEAVGKRVNQVHRKASGAWQLAFWQGRHGNWQIHEWALQQFVPILYLGKESDRLSQAHLAAVAQQADHAVVFEARGGKRMDTIIRTLKSLQVPVELDLFKDDAALPSLLD
jgi:hypothetical protein